MVVLATMIPSMPRFRARAAHYNLAHMADIEQSGIFADPLMLGHDAFILDRHGIARKADHARAERAVPAVERKGKFGFLVFAHQTRSVTFGTDNEATHAIVPSSAAPSVTGT